jgi:hypothetical protein
MISSLSLYCIYNVIPFNNYNWCILSVTPCVVSYKRRNLLIVNDRWKNHAIFLKFHEINAGCFYGKQNHKDYERVLHTNQVIALNNLEKTRGGK